MFILKLVVESEPIEYDVRFVFNLCDWQHFMFSPCKPKQIKR